MAGLFLPMLLAAQPRVEFRDHQLVIDGKSQPQLFGAEVQYFRLRGGYGPNVPRSKVLALWNKALDHFVDAKMNAISFYIPWDFHEYAEGQFDFTGSVDQDGDGRPDYPSRDLITFFKLIEERGISRIMVRPGPYINAEWGFLGFGAIPSWFHDKYPDSHMRAPYGHRSRLYDYHNPDLLHHTALWFKALHQQVLSQFMGPGKPIVFLQLDNETNFQWQSIFNHDFSRSAIFRYQDFLKNFYFDLSAVNQAHDRQWVRWNQIQPPLYPGRNVKEDQEWYRFSDYSMYNFLGKVRNLWHQIGVKEPQVLFTLAESFNAPANGVLPNYIYRNAPGKTGLMTVNLYPKTFEEGHKPLMNSPFKADLDVKSADEANDVYLGSHQEWVMGPEIQGGWWRGIDVTRESRQQTYLTVLGHGMKAIFIYYFNEGQNWDSEWTHQQISPLYEELRRERGFLSTPMAQLPEDFWNELQGRSDRQILLGFDVRRIMRLGPDHDQELYFDAPLDGQANPRDHYQHLKMLGETLFFPYQDFLARAIGANDQEVALVKDSTSHELSADPQLPAHLAAADWTGGLLGALMNADINPLVLHGDISPEDRFQDLKVLVHLDTGSNHTRTISLFKSALSRGRTIVNFLSSATPQNLQLDIPSVLLFGRQSDPTPLAFYIDHTGRFTSPTQPNAKIVTFQSSNPVYSYDEDSIKQHGCQGVLFWNDKTVGYHCPLGDGHLIQIGALIFEHYNSGAYALMPNAKEQRQFMKTLLNDSQIQPLTEFSEEAEKIVAFARKDPKRELLWMTVKTGATKAQSLRLKVSQTLLNDSLGAAETFQVTDVLAKTTQKISKSKLTKDGFSIQIEPNGSTVFVIKRYEKN